MYDSGILRTGFPTFAFETAGASLEGFCDDNLTAVVARGGLKPCVLGGAGGGECRGLDVVIFS